MPQLFFLTHWCWSASFFQHCLKFLRSDRKDVLLSNSALDSTQQVFWTSKTQRQIACNSPLTPCRFFQHFRTFLMAVQFTIATSSSLRYKVKLFIYLAWVHILQRHWFVLSYSSASRWSNTRLTTTKEARKEKNSWDQKRCLFFSPVKAGGNYRGKMPTQSVIPHLQ